MTTKTEHALSEQAHPNIELIDAYTDGLIDGSITDEVPQGSTLVLLPKQDPNWLEDNIQMGIEALRRGQNVYFRYIEPSRK